ncbi:hypothetical protein M407DRAFT_184209 [Tulasnella calospora MUT 4182]|uniref:Uncharacterized protein n=1 Tax=Tulasnella calospora MUT 4182 TaxID=1051891 RepID=A0A0C3M3B1_9AGAM|nr:hypothetical protein M407DRAFT_184209 [Tulasnella calospora MUT 4182]
MRDESSGYWAWITAAWFTILGLSLLISPRLILFLATPYNAPVAVIREAMTPLESFFCTHVGIGLLALAIALVTSVVTSIPSPPPIIRAGVVPPSQTHPLLAPLSFALVTTAFISYNTRTVGSLGIIMTFGCGITGLWGLWVMAFEGTGDHSNKTDADKHTSSFLLGNKASASEQKKLWKFWNSKASLKERESEVQGQPRQQQEEIELNDRSAGSSSSGLRRRLP